MDPISNQQFSHDAVKFVYQDPDVRFIERQPPKKPFDLKALEKSKKDLEKQKDKNKKKS